MLLSFRFEHMPERHAELAYRFGEPDESFESDAADGQGSFWTLASPLPIGAEPSSHLAWASEQLGPQEAFVRELISLGGKVVLRLRFDPSAPVAPTHFNARLLLPMAHAGVEIEW